MYGSMILKASVVLCNNGVSLISEGHCEEGQKILHDAFKAITVVMHLKCSPLAEEPNREVMKTINEMIAKSSRLLASSKSCDRKSPIKVDVALDDQDPRRLLQTHGVTNLNCVTLLRLDRAACDDSWLYPEYIFSVILQNLSSAYLLLFLEQKTGHNSQMLLQGAHKFINLSEKVLISLPSTDAFQHSIPDLYLILTVVLRNAIIITSSMGLEAENHQPRDKMRRLLNVTVEQSAQLDIIYLPCMTAPTA